MSQKVDNTYNNLLIPNQPKQQFANGVPIAKVSVQDAHAERTINDAQNVPKRRVRWKYMFVNWLMTSQNPPLQSNTRFPVSEEDIIHYSAIVELVHSSHAKYDYLSSLLILLCFFFFKLLCRTYIHCISYFLLS